MKPLTKNNLVNLLKKLNKILRNKSIYVFGAGASAYYIPIQYKLYDIAKHKLFEMTSYPIEENVPTDEQLLQLRVWGSPFVNEIGGRLVMTKEIMEFEDMLLHSYPQLLYLTGAMSYSLENEEKIQNCPEYDFFNSSNCRSLFLTLNHDRLASRFINKRVLPLHGEITARHREIIKRALPLALDIDITNFLDNNLHMVKEEDESILLKNSHYTELILRLNEKPKFNDICIVGYSFFKKNDYDIYDKIIYSLLRDYAKDYNATITIIDRNPYYIADIFSKNTNGLRFNCFEIDWSSFSHTFSHIKKINITQKQSSLNLDRFIRLYHYFCAEETRNFNGSIFTNKTICL